MEMAWKKKKEEGRKEYSKPGIHLDSSFCSR
jgi:hypothetical protein